MSLNTTPYLSDFAVAIVDWQRTAGRHGMPWQQTNNPYYIWLSEIMLQQTQVTTVMAYYERFLTRFPTVGALAQASLDDVMPYWAGLGYYARARNLHRCAQQVHTDWKGHFPKRADELMQLPGIGRSTAAAIAAFAFGERAPIMDGNVKRVFSRYFGIYGDPARRATETVLWDTAERVLEAAPPSLDMAPYTQGLMDLGATVCTRSRPACGHCPLASACYAKARGCQHELPTPRLKKHIPQRECKMLVLEDRDNAILLQKQPSPGIWGGLWSLPQYEDQTALQAACIHLGIALEPAQKMAGFEHVFSHFRLHIEPWRVITDRSLLREPDPQQTWLDIAAVDDAALPTPVRKILAGLYG